MYIEPDIEYGMVTTIMLVKLYENTSKILRPDQIPLQDALLELIEDHNNPLDNEMLDALTEYVKNNWHKLAYKKNGKLVTVSSRTAPKYYQHCINNKEIDIYLFVCLPSNLIASKIVSNPSTIPVYSTTKPGPPPLTPTSIAGIQDKVDSKQFQKIEHSQLCTTKDMIGWYRDLTTQGNSCGIFIFL